jgi:hypothetical protein
METLKLYQNNIDKFEVRLQEMLKMARQHILSHYEAPLVHLQPIVVLLTT